MILSANLQRYLPLENGLTGHKALEEWFVTEVCVVLLEVLFGSGHELDGNKLVATIDQHIVNTV